MEHGEIILVVLTMAFASFIVFILANAFDIQAKSNTRHDITTVKVIGLGLDIGSTSCFFDIQGVRHSVDCKHLVGENMTIAENDYQKWFEYP